MGEARAAESPPKHCPKCRHPKEPDDFPKSPHSKTGHLHICRKCFGKTISQGRADRRKVSVKAPKAALKALVVRPKDDPDVQLVNRALRETNGHRPANGVAGVGRLLREVVLRLASQGVELESMQVKKGKLKTTYRIEEEIDL